jgi:energy-coupling factor transport system ATP-binding protein
MTVILITHHLEDAAAFAERVAVLHQGVLLSIGSTREVLGQTELLHRAGLKAPFAVELAQRLSRAGINLPSLPLSLEDAAQLLQQLLQTNEIRLGGASL